MLPGGSLARPPVPRPIRAGSECPAGGQYATWMPLSRIRNFSIIAHIDHGKSTLADRILQLTRPWPIATCASRCSTRWTSSASAASRSRPRPCGCSSCAADGGTYELNLIDTPGHVDFTYEVSRSLAACEGALLVVDAAQGIEAQTLANAYLAIENELEIVPVVNKIDLPVGRPRRRVDRGRRPGRLRRRGRPADLGQDGPGVEAVLQAVVDRVPAPSGTLDAPGRALIFDSSYDQYRGVVAFVRVVDGTFHPRERLRAMAQGTTSRSRSWASSRPGCTPPRSSRRARSAMSSPASRTSRSCGSATRSPSTGAARPSRCPATRTSSRWCSRASSRPTPTSTRSCATRSRS